VYKIDSGPIPVSGIKGSPKSAPAIIGPNKGPNNGSRITDKSVSKAVKNASNPPSMSAYPIKKNTTFRPIKITKLNPNDLAKLIAIKTFLIFFSVLN